MTNKYIANKPFIEHNRRAATDPTHPAAEQLRRRQYRAEALAEFEKTHGITADGLKEQQKKFNKEVGAPNNQRSQGKLSGELFGPLGGLQPASQPPILPPYTAPNCSLLSPPSLRNQPGGAGCGWSGWQCIVTSAPESNPCRACLLELGVWGS